MQDFNSYEAEEILKVPLCNDWPWGEHIWAYNKSGQFFLHLTYRLILQAKVKIDTRDCSSTLTIAGFWTNLWGLNIAPKIKIFLWRLYNNHSPNI